MAARTAPKLVLSHKACLDCGEIKPLEQFGPDTHNASGRRPRCKPCQAVLSRAQRAKNPEGQRASNLRSNLRVRARFLPWLAMLKAKPCMDCGGTFPPECMDFDHVRGVKNFQIGNSAFGRSAASLFAEMDKCDLVCSNCHRTRTRTRRLGKAT